MSTAWDTERAAELARKAYGYAAAAHYPPDAHLEPLGRADAVVLEAQEAGDWPGYVEALRDLMRTAKREALRKQRGSEAGAA